MANESPGPLPDAIEAALAECLAADAPDTALELFCLEHPEHADALRRRFGMVRKMGLVEEPTIRSGHTIGRFKVLELLGEGGMGSVYLAEQQQPVRRRVALKIVRRGMDSRQMVARFEQERQALAIMDHPNIAKVLDGGETADGPPYLAMELVDGVPITQFCDEQQLDANARLQLFVTVCQAVQHAHQKGIIHRDLKPSNVLVALHNGVPVPKVIDFGIAKATAQPLTDKTLQTGAQQMVGTPEYMSPEQAELTGRDIDTRTDIYALGVLLYELLTGTLPFDSQMLKQDGYVEMLRVIREEEPHKPSTRISTLGETATNLAAVRGTDASKLGRLLRGDLDWIVMRAMEKDRERRYESADAFAADVQRHLRHEPVLAGPPSRLYRLRKYVRRHRVGATAGILVAAALILGLGAAIWGFVDANEQRERALAGEAAAKTEVARANTVLGFVDAMMSAADPQNVNDPDYKVRQLLDDFDRDLGTQLASEPEVEASVRRMIGRAYLSLGLPSKARTHLEKALALRRQVFGNEHQLVGQSLLDVANLRHDMGDYVEAERLLDEALPMQQRLLGKEHGDVALALISLGHLRLAQGRYADAEKLHRMALATCRKLGGDAQRLVVTCLGNLGGAIYHQGRYADAEELYRESLAIHEARLGDSHPFVANGLNNLALVVQDLGRLPEAVELLRRALAINRGQFDGDHPRIAGSLTNLAEAVEVQGMFGEAEELHREALAMLQKLYGDEHPRVGAALGDLGVNLLAQGRLGDAEEHHRKALAIFRSVHGGEHPHIARQLSDLANVLEALGRQREAEPLLRQALTMNRKLLGDEHPNIAPTLNNLGLVLESLGRYDEAVETLREALVRQQRLVGEEHPRVADILGNLGRALMAQRELPEAATVLRQALAMNRRLLGDAHPAIATTQNHLGNVLHWQGEVQEAEELHRAALAMRRQLQGDEHPTVPISMTNLAAVLVTRGKLVEAVQLHRQSLTLQRQLYGDQNKEVARSLQGLAMAVQAQGDPVEAAELFQRSLASFSAAMGEGHPETMTVRRQLAHLFETEGKHARAQDLSRQMVSIARRAVPPRDLDIAGGLAQLGLSLLKQGQHAEAEPILRECLTIRADKLAGHWLTSNAKSLLGGALAGLGRHEEADGLLLEGFRQMEPPPPAAVRKHEALERLIQHYESWNKPDEAAKWRRLLPAAAKGGK